MVFIKRRAACVGEVAHESVTPQRIENNTRLSVCGHDHKRPWDVPGVVLDKRKLANLAMGCSSALGTVILLLVKLGASYETDGSA